MTPTTTQTQQLGQTKSSEQRLAACPSWCSNHNGFSDGSGDWHESRHVEMDGFLMYVSTGTMTGEPELFMPDSRGASDGMTLDRAEELGSVLLALVTEARA